MMLPLNSSSSFLLPTFRQSLFFDPSLLFYYIIFYSLFFYLKFILLNEIYSISILFLLRLGQILSCNIASQP